MKSARDIRSFFKSTNNQSDKKTSNISQVVNINQVPSKSTSASIELKKDNAKEADEEENSDLGTLDNGPSQPQINFPKSNFGSRQRSFSSVYYKTYTWLEYSIKEDKTYCFNCRHFSTTIAHKQSEKFITVGSSNWKKLNDVLKKHAESSFHKTCTQKLLSHKQSVSIGNVHDQLDIQYKEAVKKNRQFLTKLIDIMLCLTQQGLPLRGHREDMTSNNKGNFVEISDLFAKYDSSFAIKLEKHINYRSPTIQNEIIHIIAQLTLKEIISEIRTCNFFSLIVDEAKCYKEEQLSIVVRYVKELEVEERFLTFLNCSVLRDAESLEGLILKFIEENKINDIPIIAQSYDGARVMSGEKGGLQAKIKDTYPEAIYIHCLAHKLNLVIVHSCQNISFAKSFFNILEALNSHFSKAGNHERLKEIQNSLGNNGSREIKSLSDTRWNLRYENCKAVLNNYSAIKQALDDEINENEDRNVVEALGLLKYIQKPDFIVSLFIFHSILLITNVLSKYFQNKDATLGQASEIIEGTILNLKEKRNQFTDLWLEIISFADKNSISLESIRSARKRKIPKKITDFLTEPIPGQSSFVELPSNIEDSDHWKVNFYYPVIDNIIANFKCRFEDIPLAQSVDSFLKLDPKKGKLFTSHYKDVFQIDTSILEAESVVMKSVLQNRNMTCNLENLKKQIRKDLTPNLYKMLQIAIGLPVSSAGCERSFSAMRRVNTWLRTTMTQERFSNLALLNIESGIIKEKITAVQVLDEFTKKNRKLKLIDNL